MKQGEGEAKSYDSIAAALADVADYHYKNNKEAYVITLNQNMSEFVTIPANSKLTIAGGRVAAMGSNYAIVNDGTLTATGGAVEAYYTAIANNGTVTVSGGSVSAEDVAIANLGKVTE